MIFSNDYDDVYNESYTYGFKFVHNGKSIGKSILVNENEIRNIGTSKSNDQNIFIYCKSCETYMDFQVGIKNELDGKWVCPVCGKTVRERTPYAQLEKENEAFLSEFDDADDDDYEEYYTDEEDYYEDDD